MLRPVVRTRVPWTRCPRRVQPGRFRIASASSDHTVKIWDLRTTFRNSFDPANQFHFGGIQFSPDVTRAYELPLEDLTQLAKTRVAVSSDKLVECRCAIEKEDGFPTIGVWKSVLL